MSSTQTRLDLTPPDGAARASTKPTPPPFSTAGFWLAVVTTGIATGLLAAALTLLLKLVQLEIWGGTGFDLLARASVAPAWRHVAVLLGAGVIVGLGQYLIRHLTSANGIEITTAIWFYAGRLPALRTLASALMSIVIVAMGAALGREGAPKQAGAVVANAIADRVALTDEERRLLVACGAGAGMAAAYGVPLGGALFAIEVLRGALALRFVLPALVTSVTATAVSWAFLPDERTYIFPTYSGSVASAAWVLLAAPLIGVVSVLYVRAVTWADAHKPKGPMAVWAPIAVLGVLGVASIAFPQLLGNGHDTAELAFNGQLAGWLLVTLMVLRLAATVSCLASGCPGGLFTPTLTIGAMLGGALGVPWSWLFPTIAPGLFALMGASAMLAATTQGPLSTIVLMMELTGYSRAAIIPIMLAVAIATLVARAIEPRSIYDARLNEEQVAARTRARDHMTLPPPV